MTANSLQCFDPLYGQIYFDQDIAPLVAAAIVQRLRHVRLSNIDSVDLPGIANISRYEHSLGVAWLVRHLGFYRSLSRVDQVALTAAGLLHDWAITAYGHLVEEALQYAGASFAHEARLYDIVSGRAAEEIGGANLQILAGREAGLPNWARALRDIVDGEDLLASITDLIRGKGQYGKIISGDIDIDNMDNVVRMAFHMGLKVDRQLPVDLALAFSGADATTGTPIFAKTAVARIADWVDLREAVYSRLMVAPRDFAGKVMLIYAVSEAFRSGDLTVRDWVLTDGALLSKLTSSELKSVRDAALRWISGETWYVTPKVWMSGKRPALGEIRKFSASMSDRIGRVCVAYGIPDKRRRQVTAMLEDGSSMSLGAVADRWLLGIGTPSARGLSKGEITTAYDESERAFDSTILGYADSVYHSVDAGGQNCLI